MLRTVPVALAFLCCFALTASAGPVLFGVDSTMDGLSSIDTTTGDITFIGHLDPTVSNPIFDANNLYMTPGSMAVLPNSSTLYVWNNSMRSGGVDNPSAGSLVTVDTATGAATRVNPAAGWGPTLGSLAFSPSGTLYGFGAGVSGFYEISTSTGIATRIGDTPSLFGADFNPLTGVLYGIGGTTLYSVDTTNGIRSAVGTISGIDGILLPGSLAWNPDRNVMMATYWRASTNDLVLFDLDLATAAGSNKVLLSLVNPPSWVSGGAITLPQGLAFVPFNLDAGSVPEPSTLALLGAAAGVLAWRRRRRRGRTAR